MRNLTETITELSILIVSFGLFLFVTVAVFVFIWIVFQIAVDNIKRWIRGLRRNKK